MLGFWDNHPHAMTLIAKFAKRTGLSLISCAMQDGPAVFYIVLLLLWHADASLMPCSKDMEMNTEPGACFEFLTLCS